VTAEISDALWPISTIWVTGKRGNPGHREMMVADPDVRIGRFKVMRRVDGPFIVVDATRPLRQMTVREREFSHAIEAWEYARRCDEWVKVREHVPHVGGSAQGSD
jgi:hypothetical protein